MSTSGPTLPAISATSALLSLLAAPVAAQLPPSVSFAGAHEIGGRAELRYDDTSGNAGAVTVAFGLRERPLATPWGEFWLDQTAFTVFSGVMAANRLTVPFIIPSDPNLVGHQLHAQGLSMQNGMTERATLTVRDVGVEPTIRIRTLVLNYDPIIESRGGRRLHEVFGWSDPRALTRQYLFDLRQISGGYVDYELVEFIDLDLWPLKRDGFRYDDNSYLAAMQSGQFHYPDNVDYDRIIADNGLVSRVDAGDVDEVVLWGAPYFGYWESQMAGPGAYWVNSPGMAHVPTNRKFVMMGLNYERGNAEALHSYGHRSESIMRHVYGSWSPQTPRHNWDLFTRYELIAPSAASLGNIHFPPNGVRDYDYANTSIVSSDADDWKRNWPALQGTRRVVSSATWGGTQHGFIRWWHDHLPRRQGVNVDSRQNNWWKYLADFNRYPHSR